jgi:hypothetical protein
VIAIAARAMIDFKRPVSRSSGVVLERGERGEPE